MSAKSNLIVANKSGYTPMSDEEMYDYWHDQGKLAGEAWNEVKDWLSDFWHDLKRSGSNFAEGFSQKTTGKSVKQNVSDAKRRINNAMLNFDDYVEDKTGKDISGHLKSLTDGTSPQTGSTAKPIVYSDWSTAAQKFGMDQKTAYAEHMANTAHQREVADLRAAGLNPVLGVGSGASGVSGHVATSGSSAQKSLSGEGIVDAIGATAAVVTALLTKNPAYGYLAGNAVNSVGDMFTKSK